MSHSANFYRLETRLQSQTGKAIGDFGMIEDGDAIPEPSSIDVIMADPDNADAVVFLVEIPTKRERKARYNITMRPSVMARIEAAATDAHTSRSAFLAEAALEKINRTD